MAKQTIVDELRECSRSFGAASAERKLALLAKLTRSERLTARELRVLHDTLQFIRAYPDDANVRRAALELATSFRARVGRLADGADTLALFDSGVPGSKIAHPFSYDVLLRMVELFPGCLEVDWQEFENEASLSDSLSVVLAPGEDQGLEDPSLGLEKWSARCKPDSARTSLEFLLALFERAGHAPRVRAQLWDACSVPVLYSLDAIGSGRIEVELPPRRIQFQGADLERERFPLAPEIRKALTVPPPLPRAAARRVLDVALAALCSRALEIYPLTFASDDDVRLVDCGRGIAIALVGVKPERRSALESLHFFLVLKNGAPIAYGPASVLFGCCEMGINLFPEFRGGEIRWIYAQFMRVLHHALGVEYFFLTKYGMGEDNDDAIASGAFWFYRKLGFVPTNAEVETLARSEEERMTREPGYRSDRRMLRRLSHTEAFLDLSNGKRAPLDLGALGVAQSRFIAAEFSGDRRRAETECLKRAARALGIRDLARWPADERRALSSLSPLLLLLPTLQLWNRNEKTTLVRAIRAKAARSKAGATRSFTTHPRFEGELRALSDV
ncbi:MAG: hypothetical protein K8S98_13335 [Planctomycetes bacterium]|nr:hypothetical protein [Planctomycetota bacterium]